VEQRRIEIMFKQLLNECVIELEVIPRAPLLIKGPDVEKDSSHKDSEEPDMEFITISQKNHEYYIPGGSIKGVMRSHGEKIARSLAPEFGCCNPFWTYRVEGKDSSIDDILKDEISCSDKLEIISRKKQLPGPEVYRLSCPICRLFGNTSLGSRFAVKDAYLSSNPRIGKRDGIAIDRFTGATKAGAKFIYQILENGNFDTKIRIRNFELWQLGLMSYILKDMREQRIRIGYGKRRGLGKIFGNVKKLEISYFGQNNIPAWKKRASSYEIWGIGKLLDEKSSDYDLCDDIVNIDFSFGFKNNGIRTTLSTNLDSIYKATAGLFGEYIQKKGLPDEMTINEIRKQMSQNTEEGENAASI
jgi:CRISPR-associated RAMP protein (TIGR02581 family)